MLSFRRPGNFISSRKRKFKPIQIYPENNQGSPLQLELPQIPSTPPKYDLDNDIPMPSIASPGYIPRDEDIDMKKSELSLSPLNLSEVKNSLENDLEINETPNNESMYGNLLKLCYSKIPGIQKDLFITSLQFEKDCSFIDGKYSEFHQQMIRCKTWYEFNQLCKDYTSRNNNYQAVLNLYYNYHHPDKDEILLVEFFERCDVIVTEKLRKENKKPPTVSICPWYLLYMIRNMVNHPNKKYVPVVQKSVSNFRSKFFMIMRHMELDKEYDLNKLDIKPEAPSFQHFKINETYVNQQINQNNNKISHLITQQQKRDLYMGIIKNMKHENFGDDEFDNRIETVNMRSDVILYDMPYESKEECSRKGHRLVRCVEANAIVCVYCGYEEFYTYRSEAFIPYSTRDYEHVTAKKLRYLFNRLHQHEDWIYDCHTKQIWAECYDKNAVKMSKKIRQYCVEHCVSKQDEYYYTLAFPVAYLKVEWAVDQLDVLMTYTYFSNENWCMTGKIVFVFYKLCQMYDDMNHTNLASKVPYVCCEKTHLARNKLWEKYCKSHNLNFIP